MTEEERNDFKSILSETIHTSFRKGCDGGGSHEVWMAIRKMDGKQWDSAIDWIIWALEYSGYEISRKTKA